ncbi:MAG: hypothetical protein F6K48_04820 [Okeania sp. SIO3H1]|nr:hypothetical protein [Okeania sp. SIO3H1]
MKSGHCDNRKQSRATPEIASFHSVSVASDLAIVALVMRSYDCALMAVA